MIRHLRLGAGLLLALVALSALAQNSQTIRGARDLGVGQVIDLRFVPPSAKGSAVWSSNKPDKVKFTPNTGLAVKMEALKSSDDLKDVEITVTFVPTTTKGTPKNYVAKTNVTVVGVEVELFRPPVIDSKETQVAREDRLTKGVQTWVNLDNDDRDKTFDLTDDDVAGDNELAKVRLVIKPKFAGFGQGKLKIDGDLAVKFWKERKKTQVDLDQNLVPADFEEVSGTLAKTVYMEGIGRSSKQQGTKITFEIDTGEQTGGRITAKDEASATILGVQRQSWLGKKNSALRDDTLTADPNWDQGSTSLTGFAVFPGAQRDTGTKKVDPAKRNDVVELQIALNVKPVEPVKLSLKSFDIDDITADDDKVDPNDKGAAGTYENSGGRTFTIDEDNRSTNKVGTIKGENADKIGTLELTDVTAKVEFMVGMQPGDSYQIVSNADPAFLKVLRNRDDEDGVEVVDPAVGKGKGAGGRIPQFAIYGSPALVVWRHVWYELDNMGRVTAANRTNGEITAIDNDDSKKVREYTTSNALRDGGEDLDRAAGAEPDQGKGRFENGVMRIADAHDLAAAEGNGRQRVVYGADTDVCAVALPAEFRDNTGAGLIVGNVVKIEDKLKLVTDLGAGLAAKYVGGTVRIAGGTAMSITALQNMGKTVQVNGLRIPYTLVDDDTAVNGAIPLSDRSLLEQVFKPAFVQFVEDPHNPNQAMAFTRNTPDATRTAAWRFDNVADHNVPEYWLVYIAQQFQGEESEDNDPGGAGRIGESQTLGIVDAVFVVGGANGQGLNMYEEAIRALELRVDVANGVSPAFTLAHEIGHLFGGQHPKAKVLPGAGGLRRIVTDASADRGLMFQTGIRGQGLEATDRFTPRTLNRIRVITNP